MPSFFSKSALLALAASGAVQAHTVFNQFYVDGVGQGIGTCLRASMARQDTNVERGLPREMGMGHPLTDLGATSMACNVGGEKGISRTCPVPGGSKLSFEFRIDPRDKTSEGIQEGHRGPCAVYMKKVDDATEATANGDGWFKIFHEGYDLENDKWCSDTLRENGGFFHAQLPDNLQGGDWLVKAEMLALHAAGNGEPQFFTSCAQIFLESDGDLLPADTVSIPGYVKPEDDSVTYNIYKKEGEYTLPGPDILEDFVSSGEAGPEEQTSGLKPEGCMLEAGNYCLVLEDYSTKEECEKTRNACYDEGTTCWKYGPGAFAKKCELFQEQQICKTIAESCNDDSPSMPDFGDRLTSEPETLDDTAVSANGVGVDSASNGSTSSPAEDSKDDDSYGEEKMDSNDAEADSTGSDYDNKKKDAEGTAADGTTNDGGKKKDSKKADADSAGNGYDEEKEGTDASPSSNEDSGYSGNGKNSTDSSPADTVDPEEEEVSYEDKEEEEGTEVSPESAEDSEKPEGYGDYSEDTTDEDTSSAEPFVEGTEEGKDTDEIAEVLDEAAEDDTDVASDSVEADADASPEYAETDASSDSADTDDSSASGAAPCPSTLKKRSFREYRRMAMRA